MLIAILMLIGAIIAEVFGSTMLKKSDGFKRILPTIGFIVGYALAFAGLSYTLLTLPLGITYTIWSGVGTAFTVLAGVLIFKEKLSKNKIVGIGLIIFGVILLNIEGAA